MSEKEFGNFKIEKASILISDLRGFTYFSEKHSALEVVNLLNRYFNLMIPIIIKYDGVVDKLIGDSILAIFKYNNTDINNVLACAIEMQNVMKKVNDANRELGLSNIHMGIGINTGDVAIGHLGNESHSEYTAIGNEVNLASRVEAYSMRGQVLLSDNSYNICKENVQVGSSYDVHPKGTLRPLKIYELLEVEKPEKLILDVENDRSEPRINVDMLINYRLIDKAKILSEVFEGQTLDVSYNGLKLKSINKLEPLSEVAIEVTSSIFGTEKSSVYARVKHSTFEDGYYISGLVFTVIDDTALASMKAFIDGAI
ncbi:PilZ domain-containing protein [Haliea sp. AH-315-K21]|uniref:Adenylate cyclase n=1 Tax=SAR86 cluster bacterium TaxID=2030880 RepID=A0A2A5CFA5_9GAMM|nr:PilZ domain-containing protein [Haliea sp. AH-315-K21]MBN4076023.1 PilZ domain-containing protein [Gammaproteobacteria bacterium AH-315-E17]PCJ42046.1 MAG: adenylate cyclase [SAR86 cluster bacterium]